MRYVVPLVVLILLAVACGGSGSSATPSPQQEVKVTVVASESEFDQDTIRVPANSRVTIDLQNEDAAPHNIAIYETRAAEEQIFVSDTIAGLGTETSGSFTAPAPGKYFFRCDVHPVVMTGDFIVE